MTEKPTGERKIILVIRNDLKDKELVDRILSALRKMLPSYIEFRAFEHVLSEHVIRRLPRPLGGLLWFAPGDLILRLDSSLSDLPEPFRSIPKFFVLRSPAGRVHVRDHFYVAISSNAEDSLEQNISRLAIRILNTLGKRETPLESYNLSRIEMSIAYARLSSRDALRLFPAPSLSALIVTCGFYAARILLTIRPALADQPTFTPPLGLNQTVFTGIVILFAGLLAILIIGLFYVGYIAKPKNQGAANTVAHLVTFLSGALLGIKAG